MCRVDRVGDGKKKAEGVLRPVPPVCVGVRCSGVHPLSVISRIRGGMEERTNVDGHKNPHGV